LRELNYSNGKRERTEGDIISGERGKILCSAKFKNAKQKTIVVPAALKKGTKVLILAKLNQR